MRKAIGIVVFLILISELMGGCGGGPSSCPRHPDPSATSDGSGGNGGSRLCEPPEH